MATELHIYDFDGTLFRSPLRPDWWPHKGWWGQPASLSMPCVPENPKNDWWIGSVVSSAKRSISNPDVWALLVTGRANTVGAIRYRVAELLKLKGLDFDEVHLNPGGSTETYKKKVIYRILSRYPHIEVVQIWEDRLNHLSSFCKFVEKMGRVCIPHPIRETEHPVICVPEDYERAQKWARVRRNVAQRWVTQMRSAASPLSFYKKKPWELTLKEFLNPYPKPRTGYVSLYHYTRSISDLESIGRTGIQRPFAHLDYHFTAKNEKPLVHFQAPADEVRSISQGGSVVPMRRDIDAKDVLSLHAKWPDPFAMLVGRTQGGYRSDIGMTEGSSNGKTIHRMYVEAAMIMGFDVPSKVLSAYPKLKMAPNDPASYENYAWAMEKKLSADH